MKPADVTRCDRILCITLRSSLADDLCPPELLRGALILSVRHITCKVCIQDIFAHDYQVSRRSDYLDGRYRLHTANRVQQCAWDSRASFCHILGTCDITSNSHRSWLFPLSASAPARSVFKTSPSDRPTLHRLHPPSLQRWPRQSTSPNDLCNASSDAPSTLFRSSLSRTGLGARSPPAPGERCALSFCHPLPPS